MITLFDGWAIEADAYCYTLCKPTNVTDKKGETRLVLKEATYHKTIKQALESLMHRYQLDLVGSKDMSLMEAVIELEALNKQFVEKFKCIESIGEKHD